VAASFRILSLGNTASQTVQLVSKIVTASLLYFGAKQVIDGSLSVGELVAFNILAGRVSAPVLRLAQMWQDFHQARLSVLRLGDILNTTAEQTYMVGRSRLPAIRGNITFDHVSLRYRIDGQEILHDVSFDVLAGQVVGIVGPSGSGKSTSPSSFNASTFQRADASWSTAWTPPWPIANPSPSTPKSIPSFGCRTRRRSAAME
jgi:subfamily B ATP-binding cassette protein HlyB/CyaB